MFSGAPPKLLRFVKAFYTAVRVYVVANGNFTSAFFAKSCILQCCPLSSSLFVLAMSSFLFDFQKNVVGKSYGTHYACADDPGGALLRITSLLILKEF